MLLTYYRNYKEELFRLIFYIVIFLTAVYFFPLLTERIKDRFVASKIESKRMAAIAHFLPKNHVDPVIVEGGEFIIDRNIHLNGDFRLLQAEEIRFAPGDEKSRHEIEEMYNRYKKSWTRELEGQGMIQWYMHHLKSDKG